MKVSEVKENMGKRVLFTIPNANYPSEYILTAYVYRLHPKDPEKRLSQLELQDVKAPHCLIIADPKGVRLKI